jgi:UPF0716 protein FxsA
MRMRTRLIVFGYPLLELLTAFGVAQLIGWGWTLLLLIAGIPVGILVMKRAGRAAFTNFRVAAQAGRLPDNDTGRHGLNFVGGALIAIPGFWTDLAGGVLLLRPVQTLLRSRYEGRFTLFAASAQMSDFPAADQPTPGGSSETIIGTVIHSEDEREPQTPDGPTEAGPSGKPEN